MHATTSVEDFLFFFEKIAGAPSCHLRRKKQKFKAFTTRRLHRKLRPHIKGNETKQGTKH